MRVLLGLSALAAFPLLVKGQTLTLSTTTGNAPTLAAQASTSTTGITSEAAFSVYYSTTTTVTTSSPAQAITTFTQGAFAQATTWNFSVGQSVKALLFNLQTNSFVAQLSYRFAGYTGNLGGAANSGQWLCDPCNVPNGYNTIPTGQTSPQGSVTTCDSFNGPPSVPNGSGGFVTGTLLGSGATAYFAGYPCASMTRAYTLTGLVGTLGSTVAQNLVGFRLYDTNQAAVGQDYLFKILLSITSVNGDPQIVGMQGQDFQVHGMPDEIFNIVTYPSIQVNARFTYLESAECHDNYTACFAHPGTYISEQGFRIGKDKVRVSAGTFKKGLSVSVNGKKIKSNVDLKSGAVEMVNHRRVVIHTDVMSFTVTNSDKFMNQEIDLKDDKLIALGAERKQLKDNERFHPEVPLHGLQGQTWRNVEYASGLDYEGSIMDYHVVDGNLFGTDFVFNQFQA